MANQLTHPVWGPGLKALRRSLYAEQVFDSVVCELQGMEQVTPVIKQSNLIELTKETSFYRNEAIGNAIRLHFLGKDDKRSAGRLMEGTVIALYRAQVFDNMAGQAVSQLESDSWLDESWLKLLDYWHQQRVQWLKAAKSSFRQVIPKVIWTQAKSQR